MSIKQELKRSWRFYTVCTLLIVSGIVVIWGYPNEWRQHELAVAVAHALLIAGILALTVDRFVKERVLKEVTTDVSKYLIGYALPKEIQDRIHDVMGTALVRHNYEHRYRLSFTGSGDVRADVQLEWDVVNYSSTPREYSARLHFDRNERPEILEISCYTPDNNAAFTLTGDELRKRLENEGDCIKADAKPIWILPRSAGIRYRIFERYSVTPSVPLNINAMGMPTIGVLILVERPEGLQTRIEAMAKATIDKGDRWECSQLFMPGEHFTLKWECTQALPEAGRR
ncbi:MAG: hypothetical protein HYS04_17195 [Acidobacteria bacterium]|nr:hypothetical protein [Acidobacteriota bacterium]